MLAKDIMTTDVVTITPEASVEEIAKLLLARGISGVPVVDAEGALVGLVSEGDLIRREGDAEHHRSWWLNLFAGPEEQARDYIKVHGRRAEEVMTREVVTVGEIARLLERRRIKRMPVMRDGRIVGIVSRANLLQGLATHENRLRTTPSPDERTIREEVLALVKREDWITHGSFNVMVSGGVVELWGWVDTEDERKALRIAVEDIAGVREVNDHLSALPPSMRGI